MAFANLYSNKTPLAGADLLNDKVLPFFEEQQQSVLRILIDRGTEYCGRADSQDYHLYLAINDIERTKTTVRVTAGQRYLRTLPQDYSA